jgi:hypothetical protein
MKTLPFEHLINEKDYQPPNCDRINGKYAYDNINVIKIEELNVCDSLEGQRLDLPVDRGYKIFWKNENNEMKFFLCGLGSETYKNFVIPNINKLTSI